MSEKNELNANQAKAIRALLEYRTIEAAAAACELNPRTIHRYFRDPQFKTALRAAEGEAIDKTTLALIALATKALGALESVLDDPSQEGASNKRLAATSILDKLMSLRELRNIEQRLVDLENRVNERA